MIRTVRFADGFDGPERVALGLTAPQLLVAVAGAALAYCIGHINGPGFVTFPIATAVAIAGSVLAWGRWGGRPVLDWAVVAGRFILSPRHGSIVLLAAGEDDLESASPGSVAPAPVDTAVQPWERWLTSNATPPVQLPEDDPDPEPVDAAASALPDSKVIAMPSDDDDAGAIDEDGHDATVILPFARAFADESEDEDEDEDEDISSSHRGGVAAAPTALGSDAPVFVGATRLVTFFALRGGAGRTTLATEVAAVLAARGRHSRGGAATEPLRVALLDLDLTSASVGIRLGVPHPTVWDYVMSETATPDDIDDYLVSHRSGLRVLLGPPKPVAPERSFDPSRIAAIVQKLETDGYHFIIFDVSGDLNPMTAWVLGAVHDIFVVLTPTSSGVQDAYRSTEALRRIGLGGKLSYVINRARGPVDMREVMGDLGGSVLASIPYDVAVEDAENAHRLASSQPGPAADAIVALAAHLYPPLQTPRARRRLQLPWRRDAG